MRNPTSGLGIAAAIVVTFAADDAFATDGVRPRSLVVWSDVPCMTIVERNADPVLAFDYGIAFEDTDHTADEVETGRRQQMVGFCRQHSPQAPLPTWLTQADVDDAASVGLLDPADIEIEDILDLGTVWQDCSTRIIADDMRRPITEAEAATGVQWDTTGLAKGGWAIEGYTWDPPFNQWSPRGGVVGVFDDASASDNPPVAAISTGELNIYADEVALVEGCVVATEGATFTASWAETVPGDQQVWTPFLENEPVVGTTFAIDFSPPEPIVGSAANIRVEIVDAADQSYTAYMREAIIVLPGSGMSCNDSGGGFLGDPGCDTSSGGSSASDTSAGTSSTSTGDVDDEASTAPEDDPPNEPSCGCTNDAPRAPWLLVPLLALATRSRSAR